MRVPLIVQMHHRRFSTLTSPCPVIHCHGVACGELYQWLLALSRSIIPPLSSFWMMESYSASSGGVCFNLLMR